MRLISAWKNFILGTWISEAGLSGADSRVRPCPVAWACTADAATVKPAAKAAPDCRKVLLVFDIWGLSFPPPRLTPLDMVTAGSREEHFRWQFGQIAGRQAKSPDGRTGIILVSANPHRDAANWLSKTTESVCLPGNLAAKTSRSVSAPSDLEQDDCNVCAQAPWRTPREAHHSVERVCQPTEFRSLLQLRISHIHAANSRRQAHTVFPIPKRALFTGRGPHPHAGQCSAVPCQVHRESAARPQTGDAAARARLRQSRQHIQFSFRALQQHFGDSRRYALNRLVAVE